MAGRGIQGLMRALGGLAGLIVLLAFPMAARATDFPVTSTADTGTGSLRQAIDDANGNSGADRIPISATGTLTLGSSLPAITETVDIVGPGQSSFIVDGTDTNAILSLAAGQTLNLSGL